MMPLIDRVLYILITEYGIAGRLSPKGDVYSYGILALETITGKRPTDPVFDIAELGGRCIPRQIVGGD